MKLTKKIIIIDDHLLFCDGLKQIIEKTLPADVLCINNPLEALAIQLSDFHLVIVDMDMPQMKGLEFIQQARILFPKLSFLIISMHNNPSLIKRAKDSKVDGYLLKDETSEVVLKGIKTILEGGSYYSEKVLQLIKDEENIPLLTKREEEILRLIVHGKILKEIADELCISIETVKTHSKNIKTKLNIHNKADLMKYALDNLIP
ncbi:response regulator transcription factor [Algivirga pacifica]|uniref:Response regulator transcription factor n=1 Tax=Algivirga pacifica TaxID=1162670 RepID=A0ABP9D7X3_9BACT